MTVSVREFFLYDLIYIKLCIIKLRCIYRQVAATRERNPPTNGMSYSGREQHTQPCYAALRANFNFNFCLLEQITSDSWFSLGQKYSYLTLLCFSALIFKKKSVFDTPLAYLFLIHDRGHVLFHLTSRCTVLIEMIIQQMKQEILPWCWFGSEARQSSKNWFT